MRIALVLAVATVALAGCIQQAAPNPEPLQPSAGPAAAAGEPVVATWQGVITLFPLSPLAHNRDTEPLIVPLQKEGFVFEITEAPSVFRTELSWSSMGTPLPELLVMVSSPVEDGKGVEYFSDFSPEAPLCIEVPAEGIVPGKWQIMAHGRNALLVDLEFTITTIGGAASILEGEPHSSAEAAETTEAESQACPESEPEA